MKRVNFSITLAVLAFLSPTPAHAQRPQGAARSAAASCNYESCALSIQPTWNGLAIVRGHSGPSVANLSFFWPRDISGAFASERRSTNADSAIAQARRAVKLRRAGAFFTDVGAAMVVAGLIGGLQDGRMDRGDAIFVGAGAAAVGVSVPLQFAADGALSRAVWWHNAVYGK